MLVSLMSKREKLQEELRSVEKQVYELETSYLQDSNYFGNVLKGCSLKRSRKLQPEDRIFSLSSVTSPLVEEHGLGRDEGRSELGQGRSKGGSVTTTGQGKPKKGRTSTREDKRIRPSSEPGIDDADDPDSSTR
ncbi:Chromatin modification-related protein Eaf6 [Dillenia turbinata]|uniref:Chromatin modification-related protein Eaf6 n=1 Tax=Dillenia turbinata TaxID=194707 RepID=A0AAN8ZC42_9MAGN